MQSYLIACASGMQTWEDPQHRDAALDNLTVHARIILPATICTASFTRYAHPKAQPSPQPHSPFGKSMHTLSGNIMHVPSPGPASDVPFQHAGYDLGLTRALAGGTVRSLPIMAAVGGAPQGDSDPLDVVEMGGKQLAAGSVHRVRALGAYAMIDEGELGAPLCVLGDDSFAAPMMRGLMP